MPLNNALSTGVRLDDWNLLRSFIAVCETQTLTAAAESLGLTQPTLGRHIRELEALVGETLFDRLPGKMRPTERAAFLMARLQPLLDSVGRFEQALWAGEEEVAGTVRITTSEALGALVLPRLLAPLLNAWPMLQVEVQASDAVQNLLRREADIAIRFFRPEQDDVIAVSVGQTELGLYGSRALVDALPQGYTPHDLKGRYIGDIGVERPIEMAAAAGYSLQRADFRFRSMSGIAHLQAVEAGLGFAGLLAVFAVDRPSLVRVFPELVAQPVSVWLCAHDDLRRSPRMRQVFDHLTVSLRQLFDAAAKASAT
ncbi:MAG: LysR family transcriptional regulator [Inhella sp.]|uniref:LysR family transcriptional regulator n=1 Tax=Inhella sp. TaxID=1921806 RepID=UPI00391F48AA